MDGGAFGRALEATILALCLISAVVGWCVIEGLICLCKWIWAHLHWVSMIAVFCTACHAADTDKPVLILHRGDPFPPVGVLYSYDSKETEADFDRRRREQEAKKVRKEDVTLSKPPVRIAAG